MSLNKLQDIKIAWILLLSDIIGLVLSLSIPYALNINDVPLHKFNVIEIFFLILILLITIYIFDLYKLNIKVLGLGQYSRLLIILFFVYIPIICIIYVAIKLFHVPTTIWGYTQTLLIAFTIFYLWSVSYRFYLTKKYIQHIERQKWLIIGTGESIQQLKLDISRDSIKGQFFFLSEEEIMGDSEQNILGTINEIDKFYTQDWAGIILSNETHSLSNEIQNKLINFHLSGVKVYNLLTFYEEFWHKIPIAHLDFTWFIMSSGFYLSHDPIGIRIKRVMDISLSLTTLLLTLPILIITALIIKLNSKGKIFFKQERVGLNEQLFMLYKFRTMYEGSETGNKYTEKNDNRITNVGKFLRKTRIDELPQVLNVLKGDMSFIGPRAEWTRCVADYEYTIPHYKLRHFIKPGITGWAQVHYPYGTSVEDAKEKLQYDLYYIKNYSIWLDALIIIKTIKVIFSGKGQ